jgi:hypothetical protein
VKVFVEDVDGSGVEVCGIQEVAGGVRADGEPFVDSRGARVIDGQDGMGGSTDRSMGTALPSTTPRPVRKSSTDDSTL